MAYRFLLEVPDALLEDAKVVVSNVPDAGVVVVRDSHGTGFDYPTKDVTVAGQSLRVLQAIYKWADDIHTSSPYARLPIRLALTNGPRANVGDVSYDQAVATIRRDQPWVDRSIPKIGVHDTRIDPSASIIQSEAVAVDTASVATPEPVGTTTLPRMEILATDDMATHDHISVEGVRSYLLRVYDLAMPERLYGELFGAQLVGRGDHPEGKGWSFLPAAYDVEQEAQDGDEPEYAFLQNGALNITLERVGRAYPLDRYAKLPEPIHLLVPMEALRMIRAKVMMRGWNVFDSLPDAFSFRDPVGYTWAIVGHDPASSGQA